MNVADLKGASKSGLENRESVEAAVMTVDSLVQELKKFVGEAAEQGESFDTVERRVHESVLQIGKQALELFIRLQGDGDLGERVVTADEQTLQRSAATSTTDFRSIFGTHRIQQFTYSPGPKQAIALRPISARMSLPPRRWSYLLQEFTQMLAVDSAYDQAMKNLETILGGRFSVATAESINADMGQAAGEFLHDLPAPPPDSEEKLLVASADCKGVPLVKADAPKVAAFETGKKQPGNRRMATVASVYTIAPHVRTAEEITAALFRDEPPADDAARPKRPKPANKNTTAHFPESHDNGDGTNLLVSGIHVAIAWIAGQIALRRRAGQVLLVLLDGQESLWNTMLLHLSFGPRTIPILDILHALSYVWEAAGLLEKSDEKRRAFTRDRLLRILRGEVRGVIRGLRCLGTTRGLTGQAARDLARICGYLETNADRMRYDKYLRRGYPIATGVIEGACRHLVKDRMERSGMRWTLEGARSMLHVRAAFQSEHWQTFLTHRMQQEVTQTHPHRNLLNDYQPTSLAC
jgi:hypothetical protein